MSVVELGGNAFPSVVNVKVGQSVRRYVPEPCDREALLALADELETDGVDCYSVSTQYVCDQYARRIREACGEVDG